MKNESSVFIYIEVEENGGPENEKDAKMGLASTTIFFKLNIFCEICVKYTQ
jgi:hypothetical protein